MSYEIFLVTVATIFTVLAALFSAPFAFDRMGWRFPGAPPLPPPPPPPPPAPRLPFAEGSPEMLELAQLRADARVIRRLLEVIGLGTIVQAQIGQRFLCPNSSMSSRDFLSTITNFSYN
ncbi:hypothetical protein BCON_0571g00010 [Botryotinia convoluta]|uniref:Uncharacterized protein n=1 Tax=Botryotinia convoluta TaxID=54673 RepID=A0A4Z1H599_9HELO|nr:hypothetical protein BCON_0571g00010 [Botryotinia convoluta]